MQWRIGGKNVHTKSKSIVGDLQWQWDYIYDTWHIRMKKKVSVMRIYNVEMRNARRSFD